MTIERRFLKGAQVRSRKGDKPGIEGIGAVYNQEYDNGWFIETIKPGAFDDVLKQDPDVRCLFNHEPDNVLGRTKSKTLRVTDSPDGLRYDCDTDPNTRIGSDVRAMIERGDVDGCSISFAVGQDCWRDEFDANGKYVRSTREIEKFAALYDVGPVTFPAYSQTSVEARSAQWPSGIPAEIRSHVPTLRSDDPTKKVDGEQLTRHCFLLVGDPDKTDTWELPWKFSTDEKTKSHLRDALARFDQVKGFSDELLDAAWKKLVMLCGHYGIDVADKERPRSASPAGEHRDEEACSCDCAACQDGRCADCDCNDGCEAENCSNEDCRCNSAERSRRMRLRIAEASA